MCLCAIIQEMADVPLKIRLKVWRIGKHLRQKEAAALIGVPLRTYQGWEYGYFVPSRKKCLACVERKLNE